MTPAPRTAGIQGASGTLLFGFTDTPVNVTLGQFPLMVGFGVTALMSVPP